MPFQEEQLDEEVEEIRELLYDILKDFPTGITSHFLEQQYRERYVSKGLVAPLPVNWLNFMRMAEEFEVKDVSTFTMLYLASTKYRNSTVTDPLLEGVEVTNGCRQLDVANGKAEPIGVGMDLANLSTENGGEKEEQGSTNESISPHSPIASFNVSDFEILPLSSLTPPNGGAVPIKLMYAIDPEVIYFRLSSWLPYCEYLYAALSRLPHPSEELTFQIGEILAAKVDGKWERVELVRMSENSNFWIVFLVDTGYFHIIHRKNFRPVTETVFAFNKIFLAKLKLGSIQSRTDSHSSSVECRARWRPETQHFVGESLRKAAMDNDRTELVLSEREGEGWRYGEGERIPSCMGELIINGVNFGDQLVNMGLAQRKSE